MIDAGSALAGTGARDGDRSNGAEIYSNHTMTPETETSTHYFWHHARNYRLDDNDFTKQLCSVFTSALNEDVVAIAAPPRSIDLNGHRPVIDINVDNCAQQARNLLDYRIADEARNNITGHGP